MTDYFELGTILKPQGIHGEVKAELYTDDPGRVHDLDCICFRTDSGYEAVRVISARTDGRFGYLRLEGTPDRNAAERMRGRVFYVDRAHAAPLPEGAFYVCDLIGLPVYRDAEEIGILRDILQTGSKDIYVTTLHSGGELMFPAVADVFTERDVAGRRIVLNGRRLEEVGVYDV